MLKRDETALPDSCWNRANPDEMVFVLLARDPAAPAAIRAWCAERVRIGKNKPGDAKLANAELCAVRMEETNRQAGTTTRPVPLVVSAG